ncbi:MAG: peptide deformylase [Alteromonadaceae bacterium]|jgi:peptide deformylase
MAVLNVLRFPDKRLRNVAKPITQITPQLQTIIDNMFETMEVEKGVGLAATQVDIHQRLIVIDVSAERDQPIVLINPEIIASEGSQTSKEGCLSVPDQYAKVERAEKVTVKALDREGNEFTLDGEELLSVCIQHEIDHLNGKLFVDYLSPLKRERIRKKLEKEARAMARKMA